MKTMSDYEIRCTQEQTKRAYKLGAPIGVTPIDDTFTPSVTIEESGEFGLFIIPTAEQMRGWLREKGFIFNIAEYKDHIFWRVAKNHWYEYGDTLIDYTQAILATIDAALSFLEKGKEK